MTANTTNFAEKDVTQLERDKESNMSGLCKPARRATASRTRTQAQIATPLAHRFPFPIWNMQFNPLDVLACDAALESMGIHAEACVESYSPNGVGAELTTPLGYSRLSTSLDIAEETHSHSFIGRC